VGPDPESGGEFFIDPDIPLPIEVPEEGVRDARAALEGLSWEMIVCGMLREIASGEARADWLGYYRRFVLAARPLIMGEFSQAAILKAEAGEHGQALEILGSLGALFPSSPSVAANRAIVMERRAELLERRSSQEAPGAFAEARAAHEKAMAMALALDPPFPDAAFNCGFFFLGRGDFARARECLSLYLARSGEGPLAEGPGGGSAGDGGFGDGDGEGMGAGDALEGEGGAGRKRRRAMEVIREIDGGGLGDEDLREAGELARSGSAEAAMLKVRGFIERRPDAWNGWFVLGWALRALGRWADGAAALEKAVELGGGSAARNELAICLMETGDLRGARRQLEAALRADGDSVKIVSNLGALALREGKRGEAAAFFRAALEIDPEDGIAREYLAGAGQPA